MVPGQKHGGAVLDHGCETDPGASLDLSEDKLQDWWMGDKENC